MAEPNIELKTEPVETPDYPGATQYAASDLEAMGARPIPQTRAIAKASATAHISFQKPDLDKLERFLTDFGMVRAKRTENVLRMRGTGSTPFIYEATKAEKSAFRGIAFQLAPDQDGDALASELGLKWQPIKDESGGEVLTLTDPNGFEVRYLRGQAKVEPLPTRSTPYPYNTPDAKARINAPIRPPLQPTPLVRFGHVVLQSPKFDESVAWYQRHLGLIPTDVFCLADGTPNMAFLRLDLGPAPADHHSVVVFGAPGPAKYAHSAYEAVDIDAIGQGQQIMKLGGWDHHWGIGRHIFGSQLFDYWRDPWGDELEHYADGDVFDASFPTRYYVLDRGGLWMWGQDLPPSMRPKPSVREFLAVIYGAMTKKLDMSFVKRLQAAMQRPPRPWLK